MRAVASVVSIVLFLAFATTGVQKLIFNTMASQSAERLGLRKRTFQGLGLVEMLGALGVMVGLAGRHGTWLALVNEICAGVLALVAVALATAYVRRGDGLRGAAPALSLAVGCLIEVALRLL
jgi:hypothetical protein